MYLTQLITMAGQVSSFGPSSIQHLFRSASDTPFPAGTGGNLYGPEVPPPQRLRADGTNATSGHVMRWCAQRLRLQPSIRRLL